MTLMIFAQILPFNGVVINLDLRFPIIWAFGAGQQDNTVDQKLPPNLVVHIRLHD